MQQTILKIPNPEIDVQHLRRTLHIKPEANIPSELTGLLAEAKTIANPKAVYKTAYIEERTDGSITIDGITFNSHLLATNLAPVYRVFPYVATAGVELHEWAKQYDDLLMRFWADSIQEQYLQLIRKTLHDELIKQFGLKQISSLNPGSLADFPLTEQPALFRLIGDPAEAVGVTLTDSLLMVPIKSISGIFYASEVDFTNCMLCLRPNCPGRQSPYDPELSARLSPAS